MKNDCSYHGRPGSESSKREEKAGHFYGGNTTRGAQEEMSAEGSVSLARNQGHERISRTIQTEEKGYMSQKPERLKRLGSHAQIKA